jgi:hypothetical protein
MKSVFVMWTARLHFNKCKFPYGNAGFYLHNSLAYYAYKNRHNTTSHFIKSICMIYFIE